MSSLVVVDTTVWSNFAVAQHPRLVLAVFPQSGSPQAVLQEIEEGRRQGHIPGVDLSWIPEIQMTPREAEKALKLSDRLDVGEAACLALAESRQLMLLTDDRPARIYARQVGVEVGGTLGVLLALVEMERLSLKEAEELHQRMIRNRYRSPVASLRELL